MSSATVKPSGAAARAINIRVDNLNAFNVQVSSIVVAITGDATIAAPGVDNSTACPLNNFVLTQGSWGNYWAVPVPPGPPEGGPVTLPYVLTPGAINNTPSADGVPATIALLPTAPPACESNLVTLSVTVS